MFPPPFSLQNYKNILYLQIYFKQKSPCKRISIYTLRLQGDSFRPMPYLAMLNVPTGMAVAVMIDM